jgi:hypothetical protein
VNSYIYNLYVSRVSREPLKTLINLITQTALRRIRRRKELTMSFINDIFDVNTTAGRIVKTAEVVVQVSNLGVSINTNRNTKKILEEVDGISSRLRDTTSVARRTEAGLTAAINQFGAAKSDKDKAAKKAAKAKAKAEKAEAKAKEEKAKADKAAADAADTKSKK